MMGEISLLKSVEEIYTMSDIWVFHVSDDAFIWSFPMTCIIPHDKNRKQKKKPEAKGS